MEKSNETPDYKQTMLHKQAKTSTTTKANAAKTGDFTPIVGAAMLAIAGTVILIVRKRK